EAVAASKPGASERAAGLRRAAAVAESRVGDLETAVRLRRAALAPEADAGGLDDLARLPRRPGDRPRLARAHRHAPELASAGNGGDRLAAVYLCAAGCVEMGLGPGAMREAEEALRDAARRSPNDLVARLALAAILRQASRWRELAELQDGIAG